MGLASSAFAVVRTAMIAGFGLIVWVPMVIASPHDMGDWGELIETFAIAGACWCFADLLVTSKRLTPRKRRAR